MHENTAQLLAALSLYFGVLHEEKAFLKPKVASVIARSGSVSDNLLREIRKLSHLLHPPPALDDVGLDSAITEYVDQLRSSSKAKIELDIAEDLGRFSRKLEIAVFRIVEEALDCIGPTSGDAFVRVRLRRSPGALEIEIHHHHRGASPAQTSTRADTPIVGIQERALEQGGLGAIHIRPNQDPAACDFAAGVANRNPRVIRHLKIPTLTSDSRPL